MRQLKASNLGSDHWRDFGDLELRVGAGQQSRLGFVRCKSPVRELEGLDRVKVSLFVIDGEIIVITILLVDRIIICEQLNLPTYKVR